MNNITNFLEKYKGNSFITGKVISVDERINVLTINNRTLEFVNDASFDYSLCIGEEKWYIFAYKNKEIIRMLRIYDKRNGGYNERKSDK